MFPKSKIPLVLILRHDGLGRKNFNQVIMISWNQILLILHTVVLVICCTWLKLLIQQFIESCKWFIWHSILCILMQKQRQHNSLIIDINWDQWQDSAAHNLVCDHDPQTFKAETLYWLRSEWLLLYVVLESCSKCWIHSSFLVSEQAFTVYFEVNLDFTHFTLYSQLKYVDQVLNLWPTIIFSPSRGDKLYKYRTLYPQKLYVCQAVVNTILLPSDQRIFCVGGTVLFDLHLFTYWLSSVRQTFLCFFKYCVQEPVKIKWHQDKRPFIPQVSGI